MNKSNVSISEYDDSFNLILGTTNEYINLLNNPYVGINVYDLDHDLKPQLSEKVKLKDCSKKDLTHTSDKNSKWLKNSICFENKGNIQLSKNWLSKEFKSIYIALDYC